MSIPAAKDSTQLTGFKPPSIGRTEPGAIKVGHIITVYRENAFAQRLFIFQNNNVPTYQTPSITKEGRYKSKNHLGQSQTTSQSPGHLRSSLCRRGRTHHVAAPDSQDYSRLPYQLGVVKRELEGNLEGLLDRQLGEYPKSGSRFHHNYRAAQAPQRVLVVGDQ
jgi:hypothetical protein